MRLGRSAFRDVKVTHVRFNDLIARVKLCFHEHVRLNYAV